MHMQAQRDAPPKRVRAMFLSDIHLGMRACQARLLLDFLAAHRADTLYLVGDIADGLRLSSRRAWARTQQQVIDRIYEHAMNGTRVIFIPGNHDHQLRKFVGWRLGQLEVALDAIHESADGRRYLVTHGDQFDAVVRHARWLACVGQVAYRVLLNANTVVNLVRQWLGLEFWSLSNWAKQKVKRAVGYISHFEDSLAAEARARGAQGVICGHIHHAADRNLDGVRYLNSGDWVESCTAILEDQHGRFEIVCWTALAGRSHSATERAPVSIPVDVMDAVCNLPEKV